MTTKKIITRALFACLIVIILFNFSAYLTLADSATAENQKFAWTDRFESETDFEYSARMSSLIHGKMTWVNSGPVVFDDWHEILEFGSGNCVSFSLILRDLLREKNISTLIVVMYNNNESSNLIFHAVVAGPNFVLDPTENISMKYSFSELTSNLSIVKKTYKDDSFVEVFGSDNNAAVCDFKSDCKIEYLMRKPTLETHNIIIT